MPPVKPMLAKPQPQDPHREALRAQVGRLPLDHLPRRRRRGDRQPQRAADDALLPRGRRRGEGQLPRARGDRRRDRGARPRAQLPGVRGAPAAHPPRREPGEPAGGRDPRQLRRVRPAGRWATRTSPSGRSASAGPGSRRRWPRRARRCTSRRSPTTTPPRSEWFDQFEGAGLDGLIAKDPEGTYQPDKRVMTKVKHERTADCVVAGYRVHKSGPDAIGSLLLGLYQDDGKLASVGVIGAFPMPTRRALVRGDAAAGHDVRRPPVGVGASGGGRPHAAQGRGAAGGTPTRTSRSCRCGPSGSSRSATTTWRASASGTPPSSCGGAPTASRPPARTSSWSSRSRSTWPRCWACLIRWRRAGRRRRRSPGRGCRARCRRSRPLPPVARTRPAACAARRPTRCPAWG